MKKVNLIITSITLLTIGSMCLFVIGIIRYDGPTGLIRRINAEIAARKPHPDLVPTPLPTATLAPNQTEQAITVIFLPTLTPTLAPPNTQTTIEPHSSPTPSPTLANIEPITEDNLNAKPSPSPTLAPAATATPWLTPTPIPLAAPGTHHPAAPAIELINFTHLWQKWNNCGPATLAMNLSHFGSEFNQLEVAAVVKPDPDDKNVSPEELADFARSQGYYAEVRVNGNTNLLRLFLSNNIPILIETWLEPEPDDGMGHYRLLTGYDDAKQQWIAYDSYVSKGIKPNEPYRGIRLAYNQLDYLWYVFNNTYILIYPPELKPTVENILADSNGPTTMWQQSLYNAQATIETDPDNAFAWFNLGSSLVAIGEFERAAAAYDQARLIGLPWRMLWYQFSPFEAYYQTGRYQELLSLTKATIATAGNIEEVYYWKGMALAAQGDTTAAREAWERAVELNVNYEDAINKLNE